MPITGNFRAAQEIESGAAKWGTGISHIFSERGGWGRNNEPPALLLMDTGETAPPIDSELTDPEGSRHWSDRYTDNDYVYYEAENPHETGMADMPPYGSTTELTRGSVTYDFPSWGPRVAGLPGGANVRALEHGAIASNTPNVLPNETVTEGWENKETSHVLDARTSDPVQYEMQTSMTQRDKVLSGTQSPQRQTDDHTSPVPSRIVGMRLKPWSGGERHYDMFPFQQDEIIRPFWYRSAGVPTFANDDYWMGANEMYVSDAYQRTSPTDPNQGPEVPATDTSSGTEYGYVSEDFGYGY